jgi:phosphomethylpyrimidine synthase
MTQIQAAQKNKITKEIKIVARNEKIKPTQLKKKVAKGLVVIPANKNHKNLKPIGIGSGLRIKINANIGASLVKSDLKQELKKLKVALEVGADTIMDLSTSYNADKIRKKIIENCDVPLGTVPIYQAAIEAGKIENMDMDNYLRVFEKHAKDGVDFATVHAGVTQRGISFN